MKKFEPTRLTESLKIQKKAATEIRKIHEQLQDDLKRLGSPESKKQYAAEWLFNKKLELKNAAQLAAIKVREQAEKDLQPVTEFARELDIDQMMRNARLVEPAPFKRPAPDELLIASERMFLSFMEAMAPALAELADNSARARMRETLEFVDAETFAQLVKDAAAAGNVALLSVAERVLHTRNFGGDSAVKAKSAFIAAKNSVQIPGLDESRDMVDAIHKSHLDILSTESAIKTDRADTRATMDRVMAKASGE